MFSNNLKILKHILEILDIETKGHNLLLVQLIYSLSKLIHTKYNIYQSRVEKTHSKLFMVCIDQIFIFQKWHHTTFIRIPTTT